MDDVIEGATPETLDESPVSLEDELFNAITVEVPDTPEDPAPEVPKTPKPTEPEVPVTTPETPDESAPDAETDPDPQDDIDTVRPTDSESTATRIRQLVEKRKAAEAEAERLRSELSAKSKPNPLATAAHPDPETEIQTLNEQYQTLKTPERLVETGYINPATGEPVDYAEAAAIIANAKQDLMFKIREAESSKVERMEMARNAENIALTMREPLLNLINTHPELDPDGDSADQDLCSLLQDTIDANTITENGLLVGYRVDPATLVGRFERVLGKLSTIRVNKGAATDKNIDKTPAKGPLGRRDATSDSKSEMDLLLAEAFGKWE